MREKGSNTEFFWYKYTNYRRSSAFGHFSCNEDAKKNLFYKSDFAKWFHRFFTKPLFLWRVITKKSGTSVFEDTCKDWNLKSQSLGLVVLESHLDVINMFVLSQYPLNLYQEKGMKGNIFGHFSW